MPRKRGRHAGSSSRKASQRKKKTGQDSVKKARRTLAEAVVEPAVVEPAVVEPVVVEPAAVEPEVESVESVGSVMEPDDEGATASASSGLPSAASPAEQSSREDSVPINPPLSRPGPFVISLVDPSQARQSRLLHAAPRALPPFDPYRAPGMTIERLTAHLAGAMGYDSPAATVSTAPAGPAASPPPAPTAWPERVVSALRGSNSSDREVLTSVIGLGA